MKIFSGCIFWRWTIVCILAIFFFSGCATDISLEQVRHDLQTHNTLAIIARQPIELSEIEFKNVVGVFDSQGKVRLAGIDINGGVHHVTLASDEPVHDEVIGRLATRTNAVDDPALDIIEYPKGTIRITAGDFEYTQSISEGGWVTGKGNRCRRYFVGNNSLFCAFVLAGEEVNTTARTDIDFYLIYIVPILWRAQVKPGKFVLAQQIASSWIIRTVIDPDTEWSADYSSFYIDIDSTSQIHLLFNCWKGGKVGLLGLTGGGGGGPSIIRRYARFQLPAALSNSQGPIDWQVIQSKSAELEWRVDSDTKIISLGSLAVNNSKMLSNNLALEAGAGDVIELLNLYEPYLGTSLGWGTRRLNGNQFNSIAVKGFPGGINFDSRDAAALLKVADDKSQHALIKACEIGWWTTPPCKMVYLQRLANGSTGAVVLESGSDRSSEARTLIVGNGRNVFAAWAAAGGKLTGNWLMRSERSPDQ